MLRALRSLVEFVAGFAFGAAIGYFAAVLLAPNEGAASRDLLLEESDVLRRKPREKVDLLQARIQFAVEEGRRAAAEARAELERGVYVPGTDEAAAASDEPA